jgi:hypothetical protein
MEHSRISGIRVLAVLVALTAGCASGEWRSTPAEPPLSRRELASRDVTVDSGDDPGLSQAVAQALVSEGFKVVSHAPYHEALELAVNVVHASGGQVAVATLRSDGFFVDEARAPIQGSDTAASLARTLAVSQAMADFVRNSGLPQQTAFSPQ